MADPTGKPFDAERVNRLTWTIVHRDFADVPWSEKEDLQADAMVIALELRKTYRPGPRAFESYVWTYLPRRLKERQAVRLRQAGWVDREPPRCADEPGIVDYLGATVALPGAAAADGESPYPGGGIASALDHMPVDDAVTAAAFGPDFIDAGIQRRSDGALPGIEKVGELHGLERRAANRAVVSLASGVKAAREVADGRQSSPPPSPAFAFHVRAAHQGPGTWREVPGVKRSAAVLDACEVRLGRPAQDAEELAEAFEQYRSRRR